MITWEMSKTLDEIRVIHH